MHNPNPPSALNTYSYIPNSFVESLMVTIKVTKNSLIVPFLLAIIK